MGIWALHGHEAIHVPNTSLSRCSTRSIRLGTQRIAFLRDTHHRVLPFPYPGFKHVLRAQATQGGSAKERSSLEQGSPQETLSLSSMQIRRWFLNSPLSQGSRAFPPAISGENQAHPTQPSQTHLIPGTPSTWGWVRGSRDSFFPQSPPQRKGRLPRTQSQS